MVILTTSHREWGFSLDIESSREKSPSAKMKNAQCDVDHANPQSGNCTVAKSAAMCANKWLFFGVPSPKE